MSDRDALSLASESAVNVGCGQPNAPKPAVVLVKALKDAAADEGIGMTLAVAIRITRAVEQTYKALSVEERLKAAILDIDAHATPLGEDADGFVTGGYLISVGCLHRALGIIGYTAPPCRLCTAESGACVRMTVEAETTAAMLREVLEALVVKQGGSLESGIEPGRPAPNYELAIRLGIGEVFGA